jgi:hypothetical protein
MRQKVEIIETLRSRNCAYVSIVQDDPYRATNLETDLDGLEENLGCIFKDGRHPFISFYLDDIKKRIY